VIRSDLLDPDALRAALHEGAIFLRPASAASLALVRAVEERAVRSFGDDLRAVHERWSGAEIFAKTRAIRAELAGEPGWLDHVAAVARGLGFAPGELRVDPPRLRVIQHRGHEDPAAAPAYYAHRDTWYGNPACQINVWIPLHDVIEDETFAFYPSLFASPIANDSGAFELDDFLRRASAGSPSPRAYPRALVAPDPAGKLPFSASRGQILLFSAAHLHEPRRNATGRTRLSVDFRLVHEADHAAGRGAPNADNQARGSTYGSYSRLP
jgi:hypothetical protein